jgi:hypothetical protein
MLEAHNKNFVSVAIKWKINFYVAFLTFKNDK